MENAAEALKIGIGVLIFGMALTVLFHMSSIIRTTSDEIFMAIDETTLYDYTVDTTDISDGRRIVTFSQIIPTIYRYAQEKYGVTIIDEGEIVARFDLTTESQVRSCIWDERDYNNILNSKFKIPNRNVKNNLAEYLNEYIYKTIKSTKKKEHYTFELDNNSEYLGFDDYEELNDLINKIYPTGDSYPDATVDIGWLANNSYNNSSIAQRINCDIFGIYYTGYEKNGIIEINGKNHKAVIVNGLLEKYKGSKFEEYIVEIDNNEYIVASDDDDDEGLYSYGTEWYAKKREIIYVKK